MTAHVDHITHAENGAPRVTAIAHWQHANGPAHCLVRAAYLPDTSEATVLVSEIASNPGNRGITANFGKVADSILPLLHQTFSAGLQRTTWIAHFGEFSYHDPAGPDTFTTISLTRHGNEFVDKRTGDTRVSETDVERLLGGWRLRPVQEVLSELGHQG
ncbi:hypothetical protein ACH4TX_12235 [Streptomyces sp. NPDC021098]|uniref:hypothetical protein n=1 Tax=unclassified Streptomyces TaxID=2593676 RepID=UPI00379D4368